LVGEERDDDRRDLLRGDQPAGRRELWTDAPWPIVVEPLLPLPGDLVLGEHPAGIDLIDAHAILAEQRVAEVPRRRLERGFGKAVGEEVRLATVGVDAADVEHASSRGPEVRQRRPRELERHEHVHGHDPLEKLARGGGEIPRRDDRRVVDEPVEPAERRHGQVDEPRGAARVGKLLDMDDRPGRAVTGSDLRGDLAGQIRLETVNDDAGPLGGGATGDRGSDAGSAAGDDHDFVGQLHGGLRWNVERF
jgi:hypothetical protein